MTNATTNVHHDFIKGALPGWYVNSPADLRKRLNRDIAFARQLQSAQATALNGLKGLGEFVTPLLSQALEQAFGARLDIERDEIWQATLSPPECTACKGYLGTSGPTRRRTWLENQLEIDSGKLPVGVEAISRRTLLQAALSNYQREEVTAATDERFSSVRKYRPDPATPTTYLPNIAAAAFMQLCRRLDLGEQYQTHLNSVFAPSTEAVMRGTPGSEQIMQALNDSALYKMLVEVHIARMKGKLSPAAYLAVLSAAGYQDDGIVHVSTEVSYLNLLQTHLRDVLVLQSTVSTRCIVYIPDDPASPFSEHGSLDELQNWLRRRLRNSSFQQFFGNFARLRDKGRLLARLKSRLSTLTTRTEQYGSGLLTSTQTLVVPDDSVSLDLKLTPVTDLTTNHFAITTQVRIREDARVLAVPVFEKDQASEIARLTELAETVLTVAGFIPGLGEAVAVIIGLQLLGEVFEGVVAWTQGDLEAALGHLENVAVNLAMAASMAIVGHELSVLLTPVRPSSFVDSMRPVTLNNGEVRLWSPNLVPFASDVVLPSGLKPDAEGVFSHRGQQYVSLEDRLYPVRQDTALNTWRVEPPRNGRFSPTLEHNGAGAWRHEGENPADWDARKSFRRLGHRVASLPEEAVEQVMRVSGADHSLLSVLHLDRQAPPAGLLDTLERFGLNQQVSTFIELINDGSRYESADPRLQLKLLPLIRGWPKERAIHVSSGLAGETLPSGRPIVVSQARIDQGKLMSTVLDALSEDEKALIFNPRRPANPMNLAFEVGRVSWDSRPLLFDTLNLLREQSTDPLVMLLKRDFPGLPTAAAREVLAEADAQQLAQMQSTQRIPLALNERVRGYLQETRVNQALEGFFLASRADHGDTHKLALHLLERLPGWPKGLRIEVRNGALNGPLLDAIGERSATQRALLVKSGSRYQAFDRRGQALQEEVLERHNFFSAVLQALPAQARQAIGFNDSAVGTLALLERIFREATSQRLRVAKILGMQQVKSGFRGPGRLLDGRFGYRLSGRGLPIASLPEADRQRLRAAYARLYPDLADNPAFVTDMANYVSSRLEEGATVELLWQEVQNRLQEMDTLSTALDGWVASTQPGTQSAVRREVADAISDAWLFNAESSPNMGRRVVFLADLDMRELAGLPELAGHYAQIRSITLDTVTATAAQLDSFLGLFPNITNLSLVRSQIAGLPERLHTLGQLAYLSLDGAGLTLDQGAMDRLMQIPNLVSLDLGGNTLGELTPVHHAHLERLWLYRTGLTQWPQWTDNLGLRLLDISANRIEHLPLQVIQNGSHAPYRMTILAYGNPLDQAELRRYWANTHGRADDVYRLEFDAPGDSRDSVSEFADASDDSSTLREIWSDSDSSERATPMPTVDIWEESGQTEFNTRMRTAWDSIEQANDAPDLLLLTQQLHQTQDFRRYHSQLSNDVLQVLEMAAGDAELRGDLNAMANDRMHGANQTCQDGIRLIFSDIQVTAYVRRALLDADTSQGAHIEARLKVMRSLFRLDEIQAIVDEEIVARKSQSLTVDDVEVRLAYRIGLARALDLPRQPHSMVFAKIAEVSEQALESARQRVLEGERGSGFIGFAVANWQWSEFLRNEYSADFARITQRFEPQMSALEDLRESDADEYERRSQEVMANREIAEHELLEQLTENIRELFFTAADAGSRRTT